MLVDELFQVIIGELCWIVDAEGARVAKSVPLDVVLTRLSLVFLDAVNKCSAKV